MSKDRTWFLIGKKLAGEASAEELNELEDLLRSDPDMHYALQNITDLWNLPTPASNDVDDAFNRHINKMKDAGVQWDQPEDAELLPGYIPTQRRSRKSLLVISIAAAVLMAASMLWYNSVTKKTTSNRPFVAGQAEKVEVRTPKGSKTAITLPDGSKVWLNAGSSLNYNKDFGGEIREVDLSGEAFFEVVPATSTATAQRIPFIIHTRHIDVRVLGTSFNVKSYPGDKQTETSLVHGKVEVLILNRRAKIVLRPNEKLIVNNEDTTAPLTGKPVAAGAASYFSVGKVNYIKADTLLAETAWVQNKLVFDNESLLEIAQKLERWYNVEIKFSDETIQTERGSGTFENINIQQALEYLREIAPFHYTMKGNKIIIGR
ncbi:MAG TPA: FecR domain-containing protein [Niastella sp.]